METIKANFRDGVIEDGYMWVFDNMIQAICKIDLKSYEMEIVDRYVGAKDYEVSWILSHEQKFYLLCSYNRNMLIYDRIDGVFLERFETDCNSYNKNDISGVFIYNDVVWIMPLYQGVSIWHYNVKSDSFYEYKELDSIITKYKAKYGVAAAYFCVHGRFLWISICGQPIYLKYDLESGNYKVYELNELDVELSGICFDGDNTWLTRLDSGNMVCVNAEGICSELNCKGNVRDAYSNLISIGNVVVLLARRVDYIGVIDKKNLSIEYFDLDINEEVYKKDNVVEKTRNGLVWNNCLYIFPYQMELFLKLDISMRNVENITLSIKGNYDAEMVRRHVARKNKIFENCSIGIEQLIKYFLIENEVSR